MSSPSFSWLFRAELRRVGLSYAAFAALVHCSKTSIAYVAEGRRPPPIDRLHAWADALRLAADAHARFILLGRLAHVHPDIARDFLALERRVSELEARLEATTIIDLTSRGGRIRKSAKRDPGVT